MGKGAGEEDGDEQNTGLPLNGKIFNQKRF
jgi:hypothetical protein